MGWIIEAWDTEDYAIVSGTHDPEEAKAAWDKYLVICFGTSSPDELEFYDELDWTTAKAYWTFEKPEETPFDMIVEPNVRPGMFPYLVVSL